MFRIIKNAVTTVSIALIAAIVHTGNAQADTSPATKPNSAAEGQDSSTAGVEGSAGKGVVVEAMDAGNYTYVHVDLGGRTIWAAAPRFEVAVGDAVTVPPGAAMKEFHSESLERTFELVYFVGRISVDGAAQATAQMPAGHPPVAGIDSHGGAREPAVAKLDKPAEGYSIAEVFGKKPDLGGQRIAVRGNVVKANMGIMGTNWYHIQDGSGNAEEGNHDLTVTGAGTASVGQTVTAVGTLNLDKDFGAGYRYDVILTDAEITVD